jgi:peptide/nickel transport system ATP-binding protein
MINTPVLELDNVKTYFTLQKGLFKTVTVKAVDGVSMRINRSETIAIVGESGSGKTTLGRTALKLVPLTSGRILFEGADISDLKGDLKWFRKKAQIIFQDPFMSLNPYMTIKNIVEEPMIVHNYSHEERNKRLEQALKDVRMSPVEEYLPKYPHMLSGGQRQRIGIARALVLDPVFIVADEPVSMIDASSRAEILYLFDGLQDKYGMGVMYITHDLATAKYFSDYIAVMYLGKIVEFGKALHVLNEPVHPYTQMLLDAVPDPDPANRLTNRAVIPGEPPSPIDPPAGCAFRSRCPLSGECKNTMPGMIDLGDNHQVLCSLGDN